MRYAHHRRMPFAMPSSAPSAPAPRALASVPATWGDDEVTEVDIPVDVLDRPPNVDPRPTKSTIPPLEARTTTLRLGTDRPADAIAVLTTFPPSMPTPVPPPRARTVTQPYIHQPTTVVVYPSTTIAILLP